MKVIKQKIEKEEYVFERPLPCWIERGNKRIGDGNGHTYSLGKMY